MSLRFHRALLALAGTALLVAVAFSALARSAAAREKCSSAKTTTIVDYDPGFLRPLLCVKAGTTLTWRSDPGNPVSNPHTVTLTDTKPRKAGRIDSGDLAPGQRFRKKLTIKGTYLFNCVHHQNMTQEVRVR